jgi:putative flippase GtrA
MTDTSPQKRTIWQLVRYIVVGIITNVSGYVLYLIVTYAGVSPILSMSVIYGIVTMMGYFGNRRLTFNDTGTIWSSGSRYVLVYGLGYVFQYAMLAIFYEQRGYPHQLVQITSGLLVTGFLFLALKYFVFPAQPATLPSTNA